MAILGLVGGLGPEGTVHYYRQLTAQLGGGHAGLVIDHVWIDRFAALVKAGAEEEVVELLGASLDRLARAGAQMAMIAAVTPHKFLPALRRRSALPLVDLVQATRAAILAAGHARVGLIGTRATLTEPFFKGALEKSGLRVSVPCEADTAFLDELIFGELARGVKSPDARLRLGRMVAETMAEAEVLVVACTDLMDLIDPQVPVIDPIGCHVRHAAAMLEARV